MKDAGYFIGLGRSFISSADNGMYLHKHRHDALDGPGCLLLPEESFLDNVIARLAQYPLEDQTPDKKYSQQLTTEYSQVSLKKWELRSESSEKAQETCEFSDESSKIKLHPSRQVRYLTAAFLQEVD